MIFDDKGKHLSKEEFDRLVALFTFVAIKMKQVCGALWMLQQMTKKLMDEKKVYQFLIYELLILNIK